jgi:hypothetical protein
VNHDHCGGETIGIECEDFFSVLESLGIILLREVGLLEELVRQKCQVLIAAEIGGELIEQCYFVWPIRRGVDFSDCFVFRRAR